MTTVSIDNNKILIDGTPTYKNRSYEGKPIEGLLFNVRAVQATFDDENPATSPLWAYPDTGNWDPERNTAEFLEALPSWRDHGVLGFTINFQGGGGRYIPEVYDTYINSGFTPQGEIKPAYADRIKRVIARADELNMVVIVGFFYWKQFNKFENTQAVWTALENGFQFLKSLRNHNILIELANETDILHKYIQLPMSEFAIDQSHRLIEYFKNRYPEFLISTSYVPVHLQSMNFQVSDEYIRASDFLMPHGNHLKPDQLEAHIKFLQNHPEFIKCPKPIIINEDSTGTPNLEVCWKNYASWGYYDQGYNGEPRIHDIWVPDQGEHQRETDVALLSGFQTPPVNWKINTPRKKAFFTRVAEITGYNK